MPKSSRDGLWPGSVGNQCLGLERGFRVGSSSPLGLQEGMETKRETFPPIPANLSFIAALLALHLFSFQIFLNMSKGAKRQRRTMVGMVSVLGCSREGGMLNS